jgi:hypothetical protein
MLLSELPPCAARGAWPAPDRAGRIRVFETVPDAVQRHQSDCFEFYTPIDGVPSFLTTSTHFLPWKGSAICAAKEGVGEFCDLQPRGGMKPRISEREGPIWYPKKPGGCSITVSHAIAQAFVGVYVHHPKKAGDCG